MNEQELSKRGLVRCQCQFCGRLFWSDRSSAIYDTASCKQKMYRWRKKLDTQTAKVIKGIDEIASYLKFDKSTPSAVSALQEIRAHVLTVLLEAKVQVVK